MRLGVEAALVRGELVVGDVEVDAGRVVGVGRLPAGRSGVAVPGFVDVQVNGYGGVDFLSAVYGAFPWIILLALILALVMLMRAFRSVVLALVAVALDVLSVGVAYGLLVVVFRFGAGDSMPGAMQTAWWSATLKYLQDPSQLDSILSDLENTAKTVYK